MCPKVVWQLQYLTLWTRTAGAAPAFGVSISTFVALVGDFMPFMPYTSRSFLHEPWTLADVGPHSQTTKTLSEPLEVSLC